jgi:hypothetical protein
LKPDLNFVWKVANASISSLVTAEEMFALCGIEHITLSANGLALLHDTPLDERFEGIRDRSLASLRQPSRLDNSDPFFTSDLETALGDVKVEALQVDALMHFGAAEVALRGIAKQELSNM